MAIYRTGPLAGGISGAVGGVVFVEPKGSKVIRHRPATLHKTQNTQALNPFNPGASLAAAIQGWLAL
ncbi:hypothetical protein LCGC14_2865340, partial [marine sediment metagenome]